MFTGIYREELRRLIEEEQAQLVEVLLGVRLGPHRWRGQHPAEELDEATAAGLDRDRPVVAYCNDFQ